MKVNLKINEILQKGILQKYNTLQMKSNLIVLDMKIFPNLLFHSNVNTTFTLCVKALFPVLKKTKQQQRGNKHIHQVLAETQMLLLCL